MARGSHPGAHITSEQPRRARNRRPAKKKRAPLSVAGILGELLITAGLLVLGYIVWQPWYTSTVVAEAQSGIANGWSETWASEAEPPSTEGMPVVPPAENGAVFANLHVPAFAPGFVNTISQSVDPASVLNNPDRGIGHYETTQLPGEPGNVALAGHRSGPLINAFREVMNLRVGDPLFVETPQGWYTYRFRSIEYVLPTETDVLNPFPRLDGAPGDDQILTLTTCHPKWAGTDERAIAYAVLESYQPLSDGVPAELAEQQKES